MKGTKLERPAVLTLEVQREIVRLLCEGNYLRMACTAAGITHATFYHWQKRWESGDPDAQKYNDFFDAVKRASAVAESRALVDVRAGGPGWQGNAWFLERRFPQRWGRRDRSPLPPPEDLSNLSDEELERRKGKMEGKGS